MDTYNPTPTLSVPSRPRLRAPAAAVALGALLAGCSDDPKPHPVPDDDAETGGDVEAVPAQTAPWLREETAAPGSITFNELLYGAPSAGELEWIELHNPMALDMDLSGWSLAGGVTYTFAEGTILPAGGFLVVAADPTDLAGALGPYDGTLSDDGERIELRNNGGRLIDTIAYGDDDPWPVQADGSGLSLAKIDPDAASDHAENWTASAELGGTPGETNLLDPLAPSTTLALVALEATWAYDTAGDYPADDWAGPAHDDGGWDRGEAIFYAGAAQEDVVATVRVTADNYFGLYLGRADGSDLRLVGEDSDGNWVTVEDFDIAVTPADHLYLAAWEAPGDSGGPQMTIAEVELPSDVVGTDASAFEWVLGPTDASPGATDPPPTEEALGLLVEDANAGASWALPAVDADRTSDPWGWATSSSFSDAAKYVWADTFADASVTNTENTYALFRSQEPLLGSRGTTELLAIPTTITFRTSFSVDADPASAELSLECLLDDGAVFYLNGVEVLRENMPAGPVDATTLAAAPVGDASPIYADLPADALVRGVNVLAVELHQAERDDPDMTFGCALTARISPETAGPTVVLNEVAPAADAPFWVELLDASPSAQDTSGLVLVSSAGGELVLPTGELGPGELLALDDVGFPVEAGDVLFLYTADRSALLDAVRVSDGLRGRAEDGGAWRSPREATPGEPNVIDVVDDIVINEIQYHRAPVSREGEPVTARSDEWIELYNRGTEAVDLGGWQFVDAVAYELPSGTVLLPGAWLVVARDADALRAEHPDIAVVGDFTGKLDNWSDRVLLLDARGNPADEVRYFDGGRWPSAPDGEGSTLELRDPRADNAAAEAWAASSEGPRSEWASYSYRGEAAPSAVGPDGAWEELVVGLLDAGEVLIDDVSVIQDPDGTPVELIQNGTFEHWRLLGNHRHSEVVPDPDDPANAVLRLLATGPTGHMHNHAETTLLGPIGTTEYEVSFRARWISGSNQVNTRLYFNRLPRTTLVQQPDLSGTPGAPNSAWVDNLGPTFADLRQDVAVPAPSEPVRVSVSVDDPDGVQGVTLWSSVEGAAFQAQAMTEQATTEGGPGHWEAELAGQAAGTIVQMYVEAEDGLGVRSMFPAAGPDSRALYRVDDDLAATNGLHNFRILVTQADSDWLHDDVNLMSDDLVGATVVYDEVEVFYDVGVRAKGSERGRPEVPRLGYGVSFHSEQPFRGSHGSVLVDRSEGVGYGQREVLMNLVMTHAGSVSGEYNDLIQALTPLPEHTGPAELQLDRFSDLVLASQFADGDSGTLFEYELIYYPLTTDDGTAEGFKLPQPDYVIGTSLTDLGDDREAYRWNFLIQNNERQDDYDRLIDLGQTFALSEPDFLAEADAVIDVDQWLRAFAFATLSGAVDNYGGDGSQHNARFYVRPEDQRVLYFPHDLDFYGSASMAVVGNSDLARLLQDPAHERSYYGHLQDIVGRAYNGAYLARWCDQLGALLPEQDVAGNCQFIADRADWVMYGSPDAVMALHPSLDFRITTGDGADFSVAATEVVLEGEAWLDVRQIALDGAAEPLELTWVDDRSWQVIVPLEAGPNAVTLLATDLRGAVVGTDSIVVTSTGG
ncbi:MAG: lamin tail domain-containing protein [Pseudomonadota bacterium]|nr:lamin tail domain-containing protein [Pseudomonadota bacterium]